MENLISVIVCSRVDPSFNLHERNVRKTVGNVGIEYIRIDNRDNHYGICAAYNEGVKRAKGNILVFMHEDVFFMEAGWGEKLISKFTDSSIGLVGVAGTQYLFANKPSWVTAGRPFIQGKVIHELDNGDKYFLTVYNWDNNDAEVVVVDGLFFAIRKELFDRIKFDEETFDGFHFYDLDICMQVRKTHRCIVTNDIIVKHTSGGSFDGVWQRYAQRFVEKYKEELPASCTTDIPDLSKRVGFESFDLKGRVPQVTIG